MQQLIRSIISLLLTIELLTLPLAINAKELKQKSKININRLVLPSEVDNLGKTHGAIYYSPSVKGKVLIPVNFWGEVNKSGLHYIPVGTSLISGLSLAGGPKTSGKLEHVKLTRTQGDKITEQQFNLTAGGNTLAYHTELKAGDTVFIPRDRFREDRVYYTSLFGVIATILSSILLYREVKQ